MISSSLIARLRLSFIWTETFTDLLDKGISQKPLVFVGTPNLYMQKFTELHKMQYEQANNSGSNDNIGFPWSPGSKRKHYFWAHYLKDKNKPPVILKELNANRAWKQLLPFRSTQNLPSVNASEGRVNVEAFYYPHGLALVINVECCAQLTIQKIVEIAFSIRRKNTFDIQLNKRCDKEAENIYKEHIKQTLNLDELAELCLNAIRRANLGLDRFPDSGIRSFDPFTVFTPVQGDGIDCNESIEDSEIHRMLEAVTTWRAPGGRLLPRLSEVSFQFDRPDSLKMGSLIYYHRRGRAIWFPVPLVDHSKRCTLSCYHKNLVFTSLQVESLSTLLISAAGGIKNNGLLSPPTYEVCARRAAGILGQLYGGAQTYTSPSAQIQIDENEWRDEIEAVRRHLNINPAELKPGRW